MYKKRILSFVLVLMMLMGSINGYASTPDANSRSIISEITASEPASGELELTAAELEEIKMLATSGTLENSGITWSFTSAGMLTISGTGAMDNFTENGAPWSDQSKYIRFIYISDGITSIGDYAFAGLSKAKSVYIPESVEAIGNNAFANCGGLKEVTFPENLKSIGERAFEYCTSLKTVTISKGVTEIDSTAFSNCSKLKEYEVAEGNSRYSAIDGVLFADNATVLVSYPDGNNNSEYTIPDGVTKIDEYAFDNCEDLEGVEFPDTLQTIGYSAFYECESLAEVNIPASVTEIAQSAFLYGMYSLEAINVDEDNEFYSSEDGALFDKAKTRLIRFPVMGEVKYGEYIMPKTVKVIGQEAFLDCQTIELMVVHGGLQKIEMGAFMYFDSLTDLWFDGTEFNWQMVDKGIFNEKLDEITIEFLVGEIEKTFDAKVGKTYYLKDYVDLMGNEALLDTLVVSSSNTEVATVDVESKTMTAISEGEAIITAIVVKDGAALAAAVRVLVSNDVDESNEGAFNLTVDDTLDLKKALSVPEEFLNTLVWNTSNSRVATVENGVVTAVSKGNAVVIATVNSDNMAAYSIRCTINVAPKYTDESHFKFNNGTITDYTGPDTEVIIPPTIGGVKVTAIGTFAFDYCTHVTKIELPETVTKIETYAFRYCTALSNINLHEGITYIGDYAFYNCSSLIKMTIPSTVANNGRYWFANCSRINTVEFAKGTKTIGEGIRGSQVKKVSLPSTVTSVSNYAFYSCGNLAEITIPNSVKTIGAYTFAYCYKLNKVALGSALESVGNYAFYYCNTLSSISLGTSVATIGSYAFASCSNLTAVTIPDSVKTLGTSVFENCSSLESISLGKDLQSIPDYAFEECSSLKRVIIPDSVQTIGYRAFYYCTELETVQLGTGVSEIDSYAFYNCTNLESVNLNNGLKSIYSYAFAYANIKSVDIPDTVTYIGSRAFYSCRSLSSVDIGGGIKKIYEYTFANTGLTKIVIPDNVTYLEKNVFSGCSKLADVTIGKGIKNITSGLFSGCSSIKTITLSEGVQTIGQDAFKKCYKLAKITLPDSLTSIDAYAFSGCTKLEDVDFGSGLKTISKYAFNNCESLETIKIPDSVTSIGKYAFAQCGLKNVDLGTGLKTIGIDAFYDCWRLSSINVPDSVTSIGSYAFERCSNLRDVNLGSGITSISSYTFYNCTGLESITIPDNVTTIGRYAFAYCYDLRELDLGNGVKTINDYAFYSCSSLETLTLTESVENVWDYAFAYCTNLEDVQIENYACRFGYNVFYGCTKLTSSADVTGTYKATSEDMLGYIPMELSYDVKTSGSVLNKEIVVNLPSGAYIIPGSMELDGELYTDFSEEEDANHSINKATIKVNKDKGTLTFCIKPQGYGSMSSSAYFVINNFGTDTKKLIGTAYFSMPEITINSADTTGKPEIIVSGSAIPNRYIDFYIDGKHAKTIYSTYSGNYRTSLTIENPEDFHEYVITAIVVNGESKRATTTVKYLSNTPNLEGLTMYYGQNGYTKKAYDLYNVTTRPLIQWGAWWRTSNYGEGFSYYFAVNVSQRETVDKVYVVSTKDNKKEYLEAKWNSYTNRYETSGYFANDCEYIPGVLTVEYTKKADGTALSLSDISTYLNFASDSFVPSVTDYTSTSYSAEVAVADELADMFGNKFNVSSETIDRDYTQVSTQELYLNDGDYYSYSLNKDSKEYVISFNLTDANNAVIYVHNITDNKQTTYTMSFVQVDGEGAEDNIAVEDILSRVDEYAGSILSVYDLDIDIEKLCDDLRMASINQNEIETGLERAENLNIKKQMFILTSIVLSASSLEGISVPAQVLDLMIDSIDNDISYFSNLKLLNIFQIGSECKIRWMLDPSGYIFEGVTDNRLEGVTATIYYIENEDIPDDIPTNADGSRQLGDYPIDDPLVKMWDASEGGQQNPLITGEDGTYQWNVPEQRHYRVKYEKDGYETAYSEWMMVPPPRTNVNISLVSYAEPKVEKVNLTDEYMVVTFDKYMKPDTVKNVKVGDATYTVDYDKTKTDTDGNVFAKEYTFKFDTKLISGMNYAVSVTGAESYANIAMQDYSETLQTPGEPLPKELIISNVTVDTNKITVDYINNTGDTVTFNAVCAVYDAADNLVDIEIRSVEDFKNGTDTDREFTFNTAWSYYKLYTWSKDIRLKPVLKSLDNKIK